MKRFRDVWNASVVGEIKVQLKKRKLNVGGTNPVLLDRFCADAGRSHKLEYDELSETKRNSVVDLIQLNNLARKNHTWTVQQVRFIAGPLLSVPQHQWPANDDTESRMKFNVLG